MPQLIPSILEETKEHFLDTMSRELKLSGLKRIQVDFGDGIFIDRKLVPVSEIDALNPAFEWEAHLMIREPTDFLDYKIAGFNIILIHFEAFASEGDVHQAISAIKAQGLRPGLVINPGTAVWVLKDFEKTVSHFQLMGVHPGYQGQQFIEQTVNRVGELRKLIGSAIIEVDGGVNLANLKQLTHAGADLLVLGSVITKAPDMGEAWDRLNQQLTISAKGGSASGGND